MAKVTRTKVSVVMKTTDEAGNKTFAVLGEVSEKAAELIRNQNGKNTEVGYMPLTYEMEEESFINAADMVTDWEVTPVFPKAVSCPKSAAELKKFMKNQ